MSHKHKDLIIAWANGADIEGFDPFLNKWYPSTYPSWMEENAYRLKPDAFTQKMIDAYKRGDKIKYRLNVKYATKWYDLDFVNPEDIETYNFDQLTYKWSIEPKESVYEDPADDINEILDFFDFERVKKVMDHLNWEWAGSDGVPEIYELRQHARKLMNTAVTECIKSKQEDYFTECGGFRVECNKYNDDPKIYIRLSFNVTSWENWN